MKRFLHFLKHLFRKDVNRPYSPMKSSWQNFDVADLSLEDELDLIQDAFDETRIITAVFVTEDCEFLVQIFSDGQAHLAVRESSDDSWLPGWWTVANEYDAQS